ncbi:MAG: alkaline phosphatase [Hyphomonadaceae bacterium]
MQLSRRALLAAASLAAAPVPAWARGFSRGAFTHGIASGDPTADAVILWARFVPADGADARIGWEIAEDEAFAQSARRGALSVSARTDFCAKVDVRGLAPGRPYFYRFLAADGPSLTGRTRTAPRGPADRLSLAFFSCSNLPWGYFHAYGDAAAREDIDLCLHLGDYIYELQRGAYPSAQEAVPGRVIEPAGETVTWAEYCARHQSYHLDPDLQELRRLKPLCVVWDDHDFANDAWMHGAQNHQPSEGAWSTRAAAARKAYFDWMPIRHHNSRDAYIQRSLDWGDLARILLLDTRLIGRDRQLVYERDLLPHMDGADSAAALAAFRARLDDPARQLLGAPQERWLAAQMAQSRAHGQAWQILAQQVVVAPQRAPQGLSRLLSPDASPRNWFALAECMAALGLPWNLDCWDGYPAARARLLAMCETQAANAIILSGDSHNCWVSTLAAPGKAERRAALEFAGGSVSSPGFERTLTNAQPGEREALIQSANPALAFTDLTNRGYGALQLTRTRCEAEWRAFSDIRTPTRGPPVNARFAAEASLRAGPGAWAM